MLYVIPLNKLTCTYIHTHTHAHTQKHTQLKSSKNAMHGYCRVDMNELEQFFLKKYFGQYILKKWKMKECAKDEKIHENCKDYASLESIQPSYSGSVC